MTQGFTGFSLQIAWVYTECLILTTTMPTRAQEADEDEGDENIDQDLRKNRLAISLALGRRKKRK